MSDWHIYTGKQQPHDGVERLPAPPPWRRYDSYERGVERGASYQASPQEIELVNAALYLRRPLLITGKPGSGKTSLAYAVAYELKLGPVLVWPITTRSTLQDGLYRYDAIGRLQEAKQQRQGEDSLPDIGPYIQLGPLGTALFASDRPRVLLIDEIDKSDIDLPNDLLNVFEEGYFEIPELARLAQKIERVEVRCWQSLDTAVIERGLVRCTSFPLIIMTSNGEREFPPAFLRRCLRLHMQLPDEAKVIEIVKALLGTEGVTKGRQLIEKYGSQLEELGLATDQLLNAIYLATRGIDPLGPDKDQLNQILFKPLSSTDE